MIDFPWITLVGSAEWSRPSRVDELVSADHSTSFLQAFRECGRGAPVDEFVRR